MEGDDDDGPPMLVEANGSLDPAGETPNGSIEDVKPIKVPITIITGGLQHSLQLARTRLDV